MATQNDRIPASGQPLAQRTSYYITAYHNRLLSALCSDERMIQASFSRLPSSVTAKNSYVSAGRNVSMGAPATPVRNVSAGASATPVRNVSMGALATPVRNVSAGASVTPVRNSPPVGSIIVGRIGQVAANIQAMFVDIAPGIRGFLPFKNIKAPIYCSGTEHTAMPVQGDVIVVQVIRAAVKTKEAVLSTELTLPGRYIVLDRLGKSIHYSGKVSQKQRENMKDWLTQQNISASTRGKYGYILRTNAFSLTDRSPVLKEMELLAGKMEHICSFAASRTLYSVLDAPYEDYIAALRDTYSLSFDRIVTDIPEVYGQLQAYFKESDDQDALQKLSFFDSGKKVMTLLNFYKLDDKVAEALGKNVWLKSGGYLVIEPTESLTAIDVNTGKYTGKSAAEDTFLKINLEAAEMIALQMRLRNLSGMILVDFINMKEPAHNDMLLERLRACVLKDPVHTSVIDMTPLGLVEITRKKILKNLKEQYYEAAVFE